MSRRILLDDEAWLITVGLLGGIRVHFKPWGRPCIVHSGERRHLYDIADELRKAGAPLDRENPAFAAVLSEFAERVLLRGDREWQRFFIDSSAREVAAEALAAHPLPARPLRGQAAAARAAGQEPAAGLWKRLGTAVTPGNLRLLLPVRDRPH